MGRLIALWQIKNVKETGELDKSLYCIQKKEKTSKERIISFCHDDKNKIMQVYLMMQTWFFQLIKDFMFKANVKIIKG